MKHKLLLISVALALPAFAGTPTTTTYTPPPTTQPSLWSWFIGGSAGYLVDAEEGYYAAQLGVDTPWNVGGWNMAMYLEVGFSKFDESYRNNNLPVDVETDMMPVTFNFKFERPLSGNLNAYVGAGLGAAFFDIDASSRNWSASDEETVFTGSVFAGLVYNFTPAFEVFGGARWMYMDDTEIRGYDTGSGDDWLLEAGLRFNF